MIKTILKIIITCFIFLIVLSCSDDNSSPTGPKIVANPTFSVNGGSFANEFFLEVNCDTEGAIIRFTINGTDPTNESNVFDSPMKISTTRDIKIKGFKDGYTSSEVIRETYVLFQKEMIYVPGGTFMMGDTRGEGTEFELPIHEVTLSAFYISNYELTQLEYESVMDINPSDTSYVNPFYPANNMSWVDAIVFCNRLSEREGLNQCYHEISNHWGCDLTANGYRLPTEAEWEYAARGGTNIPDFLYSGSDDFTEVAWTSNWANKVDSGLHVVGAKKPNSLGIYDMSGNVREMCNDYSTNYPDFPVTNPIGGSFGRKINRGGRNELTEYNARVTSRASYEEDQGYNMIGFRLVRSGE